MVISGKPQVKSYSIRTIEWKNNKVCIIDQTQLPTKLRYLSIGKVDDLWTAIKLLKVRGAPAIGAAAAFGVYLGVRNSRAKNFEEFRSEFEKVCDYVGSARPTARNLFWAIERMRSVAMKNASRPIAEVKTALLNEAESIVEEDRVACRNIGRHGASLIRRGSKILTVCNAGALATIDYGTALGVIYSAQEQGKNVEVFACETRPLLQGARLTAWELMKNDVPVTLLCDNMAAALMKQGKIDLVIAGADRIAANGDTANKIGTYGLAVLSAYHKIPFYIAAPSSTFDLSLSDGSMIPIEQRGSEEVTDLFFKMPIAPRGVRTFNPAFDVTPHELITAIITETGIIKPPFVRNIPKILF